MKTLKKTAQKNVLLNRSFYTDQEIQELARFESVTLFDSHMKQIEMKDLEEELDKWWWNKDNLSIRVFLENTKEIKVIYHKEFESYETVVVMQDDSILFIEL